MANNYLNLNTDQTLGGTTPSDYEAPSQKAVKGYVDNTSEPKTEYESDSDVVAAAIAGLEARVAALEQRLSPEGNLGNVNVDELSVIKKFNNYTIE